VRDRLLDRSRKTGEDFQFLLQRYAAERFLYRLGESRHRDRYVLKGATLFAIWGSAIYRGTRDLDFTGYGANEVGSVLGAMQDVCAVAVADDGITFDTKNLSARPIREQAEYDGLRVQFQARLGAARIPMQVDIGFGNAIEPPPTEADYPSLLDLPLPRIRAYPQEAVIAEKLHAMVVLGERNSRYKDFYDLYVFARQFSFDGERLTTAIAATFDRRRTTIELPLPAAVAPRYYAEGERAAFWRAYLGRNSLPGAPADWVAVGELLRQFLSSPYRAIADGRAFSDTWLPGGPWAASLTQRPASAKNAQCALRRFRWYPAYKDSGVEWLGEIPAHWGVKRLKRLADIASGFSPPQSYDRSVGEYPVYGSNGLIGYCDDYFITEETLAVGRVGASGSVCNIPAQSWVSDNALLLRKLRQAYRLPWLRYVLEAMNLGSQAAKNAQPIITGTFLGNQELATPPEPDQYGIATFLDRETAKIDVLVGKKERFIALLQEKGTALITHAVTRGLDPNVSMKDSGVEWLGEIPTHWDVKRLAHTTSKIGSGKTPSGGAEVYTSDGVMLLRSQNIHFGDLRLADVAFIDVVTDAEMAGSRVQESDVLLNITGASLGRCCVAHLNGIPANVNQHVCVIRPRGQFFEPEFLALAVASQAVQAQIFNTENGISRDALNFEQIGQLRIARPPLGEQHDILAFSNRETAKIDALIEKILDAIDQLNELRTALISAAVTGKIDLREEAA
jgi:type I restriction enzyme S subunit